MWFLKHSTFCIMGQWVYNYSKFKIIFVDVVRTSFKKQKVIIIKPEAKWFNHEQVE